MFFKDKQNKKTNRRNLMKTYNILTRSSSSPSCYKGLKTHHSAHLSPKTNRHQTKSFSFCSVHHMWMETSSCCATGTCLALDFFMVGMYFMPFPFMGPLKDYLCFPWFGPVVCQSSCPFLRRECRLPSNGPWSAPASLLR